MRSDYTHITFVLDNSGSMAPRRTDTIGAYNEFLREQQALPGKLTWSLYEFQSGYNMRLTTTTTIVGNPTVVPGVPGLGQSPGVFQPLPMKTSHLDLASSDTVCPVFEMKPGDQVPQLSLETYGCDTMTPLLDAMGEAIERTGQFLAALPEVDRPSKVVTVILTDGFENASTKWTHAQVTKAIKHKTEVYNWQFIYLGANQDAIQVGTSYGISAGSSMTYNMANMGSTLRVMSGSVASYRTTGEAVAFTDEQRATAVGGETK